jgi:N-acetylglucosamine kinase-like BadF-type ATPase
MHAWGCETVDELVARAHGEADWAALAPAVGRAARDGDELARIILRHAGEELAWLAAMMAQQARVTEIAWTGNVLARIDGVGAAMQAALSREVPGVRLMDEPADSVMGALWRANRLARS